MAQADKTGDREVGSRFSLYRLSKRYMEQLINDLEKSLLQLSEIVNCIVSK